MTRCYIRLLPDIPFVLFYEDNGVEYWMAQEFNESGSVTTTLIDNHHEIATDALASAIQPPSSSELCTCSLATMILSSSSRSLHQQLFSDFNDSFVAVLHRFPLDSTAISLSPPLTASCELLLRYSYQPYSTFSLDADRFHEELQVLQSIKSGTWSILSEEILSTLPVQPSTSLQTTSIDYTDFIYQKGLHCGSKEQLAADIRQHLKALMTLPSPPFVAPSNRTQLAELIRKGLKQAVSTNREESMRQWSEEVDSISDLIPFWLEVGLWSLMNRVSEAFNARHLLIAELTILPEEQRDWKHSSLWILSIQQMIRLLGFACLIEFMVSFLPPAEPKVPSQPSVLSFCVDILQRAVTSSSASTMLLLLPPDLASKLLSSFPAPEIVLVDRKLKSGCEHHLELNETETRTMQFFAAKPMLKQHYLTKEEEDDLERIVKAHCGEEITREAMKNLEMRNV